MKTAGIIAEYNPFHNGHAYHIEETRKQTGADYIIAVLSGNFVQRGAPAISDKYERAQMALKNGVDLVIELPVTAALSSAEGFAGGGVSLLAKLGVVTDLSFGAEIFNLEEIKILFSAARIFAFEPEQFQELLLSHLKAGNSFPSARLAALDQYLSAQNSEEFSFHELLSSPNNILAIEYLKTILRCRYSLRPCVITRTGSGYHDLNMENAFSSASAIRNLLADCGGNLHAFSNTYNSMAGDLLSQAVPASVYQQMSSASEKHLFLQEDHFSDLLYYALTEHAAKLDQYGLINTDFSLRIKKKLEQFESWTQFTLALKSKNQTYTAISRALCHILLGITREHMTMAADFQYAPYARVLGFCKEAAPLLKELEQKSMIPVITRLAKQREFLSAEQQSLLDLDIRASEIYDRIRFSISGQKSLSEYRQPLIYL